MEFCFVVFSHTGNQEKERILNASLRSLRNFGYPIVLASHLPVSPENQELADYFIKDNDNLIVDESDIINPHQGSIIESDLYYVHDSFGGKTFSTNTFKKTYQPGVFNLYINSINLVKSLGFKNIILWEFDFLLGKDSAEKFLTIIQEYSAMDHEYFGFNSYIQDLNCLHAIPSILNVELLGSVFPDKPIKDPKMFPLVSNLMIMEQWVRQRLIRAGARGKTIDYTSIGNYLPDSSKGQVHSQLGSYMFFNLRSGVYFSNNSDKMIYYTSNSSGVSLKSTLEIFNKKDGSMMFRSEHAANPNNWAYDFLPQSVIQASFSEEGIEVIETIEEIENSKSNSFTYVINGSNRSYASKLRKYSDN